MRRYDEGDISILVTRGHFYFGTTPNRAHIDILYDLSLGALHEKHPFSNFVELQRAWQKTLSLSALNKRFYQQIANWYFWAIRHVEFPRPPELSDEKGYRQQSVIRLLTRLIFCWFLKEKGLVPEELFLASRIVGHLRGQPDLAKSRDSLYYKAVLQNLFFATLNRPMNRDEAGSRRFTRHTKEDHLASYYHHEKVITDPLAFLNLLENVPFLNGGLFENLDHRVEQGASPYSREVRIDGFTDDVVKQPKVPDFLFFGSPHNEDLSEDYGEDRYRAANVQGLMEILHAFKFTVAENTPVEEEVALDPELLGRVFENLLAAFNPETGTTARKQTGSFYTPREIVDYIVDETVLGHLQGALGSSRATAEVERNFRVLFAYNDQPNPFPSDETHRLVEIIQSTTLLDPACGSGAFPMGALLKLVHVLSRLDPQNKLWREKQEQAAKEIPNAAARKGALEAVKQAFMRDDDFTRKLFLIENCLYGVDLQPIAVQITKLRFFISLIVNQKPVETQENRGILSLPNLETKFVAANTLIAAKRPKSGDQLGLTLRINDFERLESELREIRRQHVTVRSWPEKKALRAEDRKKSKELGMLLREQAGFSVESAEMLVKWHPYDQNASSPFFDAKWMFNVSGGFDICFGNPPYLRVQGMQQTQPEFVPIYKERFQSARGNFDLYALFIERSYSLLKPKGQLAFIVPHKFFQASFGAALRELLTRRKALTQVVRFGAEQVFEEATTYTCLLFLSAQPSEHFDLMEVKTLDRADEMFVALRRRQFYEDYAFQRLPAPASTNWEFTVGTNNRVLERLKQHPFTLQTITRKIFVGLQTSLDKLYVLGVVDDRGSSYIVRCRFDDSEIEIERGLVKPFLMGRDVHRYEPIVAKQVVIFPYLIEAGRASLMTQSYIRKHFPKGWSFLKKHETALSEREHGRMRGDSFYAYIYPKNLAEFAATKIMTPEIALGCQMSIDELGVFYHTTKVYSFVFNDAYSATPKFFLGVLNSKVLWYFLSSTGYVLRGGYYTFKTDYLRPFPIPASTPEQQKPIETLVDYVLRLRAAASDSSGNTIRERLAAAYFEQLIDALVYELYFPEEFRGDGRSVHALLKKEEFPNLSAGKSAAPALRGVQAFFERLFANEHPVRRAIFFLDSCETIQAIESKSRENYED